MSVHLAAFKIYTALYNGKVCFISLYYTVPNMLILDAILATVQVKK